MRLKLSKSSIDQFYRCPRSWYYKYVLRRVPVADTESVDLNFGKAFHDSIDRWAPQFETYNLPDDEIIKGEELFAGYQEMYDRPDGAAEEQFTLDCGAYDFVGVFDNIDVKQRHVIETKTTRSWVTNDYWTVVPLQPQVILYTWAAKVLHNVDCDVTWDVVQRCKLKWSRRENEAQYRARVSDWIYEKRSELYQRRRLSFDEINVNEAPTIIGGLADFLGHIYELADNDPSEIDFPMHGSSCRAFGRLCGYAEVCIGTGLITDDALYQERNR